MAGTSSYVRLFDAHCSIASITHGNTPVQPEDLQKLVTTRMPYGKYQGRLLADLPGAYLPGSRARAFRTASWAGCWR
jgi:hypothetical protein